jgi:hypothetical protein
LSPEPPVSVEAVQERLIWLQLTAVAERPVGTDGGVASGQAGVVALAGPPGVERLYLLSTAATVKV